jgi:hypothetical protein
MGMHASIASATFWSLRARVLVTLYIQLAVDCVILGNVVELAFIAICVSGRRITCSSNEKEDLVRRTFCPRTHDNVAAAERPRIEYVSNYVVKGGFLSPLQLFMLKYRTPRSSSRRRRYMAALVNIKERRSAFARHVDGVSMVSQ